MLSSVGRRDSLDGEKVWETLKENNVFTEANLEGSSRALRQIKRFEFGSVQVRKDNLSDRPKRCTEAQNTILVGH